MSKQTTRALIMLMNQLEGPQTVILYVNMLKDGQKVMETFEVRISVEGS